MHIFKMHQVGSTRFQSFQLTMSCIYIMGKVLAFLTPVPIITYFDFLITLGLLPCFSNFDCFIDHQDMFV